MTNFLRVSCFGLFTIAYELLLLVSCCLLASDDSLKNYLQLTLLVVVVVVVVVVAAWAAIKHDIFVCCSITSCASDYENSTT